MNFKNSKLEKRFNNFWNNDVVTRDAKIRAHFREGTIFFPPTLEVNMLIKRYLEALNTLIANIIRMCVDFNDKEYINEYIKETIKTASADFIFYKTVLFYKKWDLNEFELTLKNAHPLFKEALEKNGTIVKTDLLLEITNVIK